MWETYEWGRSRYDILYKDGSTEKIKSACFAALTRTTNSTIKRIKLYDFKCKPTIEYRKWYLEYVSDMLQLEEVEITEDYIAFDAYDNKNKNMLVLSLFRFLYEQLGYVTPIIQTHEVFLEPLRNGECEYIDKLERFCYFYSKIETKKAYYSTIHSWYPKTTVIKSTEDFLKIKKLPSVNSFFTYEKN